MHISSEAIHLADVSQQSADDTGNLLDPFVSAGTEYIMTFPFRSDPIYLKRKVCAVVWPEEIV